MKKDIHPKYYDNIKVKCICGVEFLIASTKEVLKTEVCSKCHPFYTGKKTTLDVMGNIEKFNKRMSKKIEKQERKKEKAIKTKQNNKKLKTVNL